MQDGAFPPFPPKSAMTDIASRIPAAPGRESAGEDRTLSLPALVVLAFVIGIVAALGAVVFRAMIAVVHNLFFLGTFSLVWDANRFDPPSPWGPFVILAPVIGGLVVVWLVRRFAPEAKGHGVPEVMYAVYHNRGNVRGVVAIVKSIASAISTARAPRSAARSIIQIGASSARRWRASCRWRSGRRSRFAAGPAHAAIFNTPLGAPCSPSSSCCRR